MTRQTSTPLQRLPIDTFRRQARWLVKQIETGEIDINPPYQRGSVWTEDQRVALMRSLLSGTPVQSIIINDRHGDWWTDTDNYDRHNAHGIASYVVVDGKQRLLCLSAWFNNELAIPASWLPAEEVLHTEDTPDGPYVRASGLTDLGRRMTGERIQLAVAEGQMGSLREEAAVYVLVNGQGTPQADADMANAQRVAEGK
ncbi:DUF262 domain-containing protein [Micromonospora wenchangensis]|uniref:DUF262 domain-containing protein n=1 Tax=Micromonospora wenchangensis TaxID=1185415 RepID=UPI00382B2C87